MKTDTENLRKLRAIAERDQLARNTVLGLIERAHEANTMDAKLAATGVLAEVYAERMCQDAKWGEQNHPNGTGDSNELLRGRHIPKPHEHVGITMGTLANTAREVTDTAAAEGTVSWADILLEEVFEALAEHDPAKIRMELIQVAAVAIQWASAIDRRADHLATQ